MAEEEGVEEVKEEWNEEEKGRRRRLEQVGLGERKKVVERSSVNWHCVHLIPGEEVSTARSEEVGVGGEQKLGGQFLGSDYMYMEMDERKLLAYCKCN